MPVRAMHVTYLLMSWVATSKFCASPVYNLLPSNSPANYLFIIISVYA